MDAGVLGAAVVGVVAALVAAVVGGEVVADDDAVPEAVAVAICGEIGEPGGAEVASPDVGMASLA